MMAFQSLLREDDVYVFYSDSSEDGELSNDDYFSPFSNTWSNEVVSSESSLMVSLFATEHKAKSFIECFQEDPFPKSMDVPIPPVFLPAVPMMSLKKPCRQSDDDSSYNSGTSDIDDEDDDEDDREDEGVHTDNQPCATAGKKRRYRARRPVSSKRWRAQHVLDPDAEHKTLRIALLTRLRNHINMIAGKVVAKAHWGDAPVNSFTSRMRGCLFAAAVGVDIVTRLGDDRFVAGQQFDSLLDRCAGPISHRPVAKLDCFVSLYTHFGMAPSSTSKLTGLWLAMMDNRDAFVDAANKLPGRLAD